jgi:hypothetical protein
MLCPDFWNCCVLAQRQSHRPSEIQPCVLKVSNDSQIRKILRRLAGQNRKAPPPRLHHCTRRPKISGENAAGGPCGKAPKPYGAAQAIAQAFADAAPRRSPTRYAAEQFAAALAAAQDKNIEGAIGGLILAWKQRYSLSVVEKHTWILRRILKRIDAETGAKLLPHAPIPRIAPQRTQTITQEEVDALMAHAPPHMRLLVSLMLSMALRISEALRAAPENYDAEKRTLRIITKGSKIKTFPVPENIHALFDLAPTEITGSYVERLW